MSRAQEELAALNAAIAKAEAVLSPHRGLIRRYEEESRHFDSVGPILDPTLWNSAERRKVAAIVSPLYAATERFLEAAETARTQAMDLLFAGELP